MSVVAPELVLTCNPFPNRFKRVHILVVRLQPATHLLHTAIRLASGIEGPKVNASMNRYKVRGVKDKA